MYILVSSIDNVWTGGFVDLWELVAANGDFGSETVSVFSLGGHVLVVHFFRSNA